MYLSLLASVNKQNMAKPREKLVEMFYVWKVCLLFRAELFLGRGEKGFVVERHKCELH